MSKLQIAVAELSAYVERGGTDPDEIRNYLYRIDVALEQEAR